MLYDLLSFVWLCLFVCVLLFYVFMRVVCDVLRVLHGCRLLFVFVCVCLCVSSLFYVCVVLSVV